MTIQELLTIETRQLKNYLAGLPGAITGQDYIFIPGNNPIGIVAHIDTVPRGKIKLIEQNGIIRNKHGILGADDRAGVYAALKIRQQLTVKPPLIFTDKEESGGIGAKEIAKRKDLIPTELNLLIELDRKGCNECVTYTAQPDAVIKYAESYGYTKDHGSYSDITDISPAWEIPAVNLSIGYHHQHTCSERLHTDEMNLSINRVIQMCLNPIAKRHKLPKNKYDFIDYEYSKRKMYKRDFFSYPYDNQECELCGTYIHKLHNYDGLHICTDCYSFYAIEQQEIAADRYSFF